MNAKQRTSRRPVRIAAKWRKIAEERCAEKGARLTPARLGAYAELLASDRPLTAYELIACLEKTENRKIAPLTVYRHLEFLIGVGLVHRLESTQSYLPCEHPEHTHESQYLLCSSCGHVDELESKKLGSLLSSIADKHDFQPSNAIVEVTGLCGDCAKAGA
ncbi:MAG: Fur family transcriptional regulator [Pseudomonadota bacterium]